MLINSCGIGECSQKANIHLELPSWKVTIQAILFTKNSTQLGNWTRLPLGWTLKTVWAWRRGGWGWGRHSRRMEPRGVTGSGNFQPQPQETQDLTLPRRGQTLCCIHQGDVRNWVETFKLFTHIKSASKNWVGFFFFFKEDVWIGFLWRELFGVSPTLPLGWGHAWWSAQV